MKTNFERGQLNAQDDLNENFVEIENELTKFDKMFTTTIYNSDGEVSSLPYNGAVFGFGSQINTNGTTPAFSVNEKHEAVCEIPGTYSVVAQIRLQFNTSSDGYVYIDLLKNGTAINANSGMFAMGGGGMRNRNAHAGHNVITLAKGDKLSWKTSSNLSGNLAFAGCFSFAATRLDDKNWGV